MAAAAQKCGEAKNDITLILALLGDAAFKTDAQKAELRQLIRKELDQCVDWATVARSSLGRHSQATRGRCFAAFSSSPVGR